jgi:predicted protein tyrosine phosphatase
MVGMAPTIPDLIITSLAEAPRVLLSKSRGPAVSCIVSIGDPGEKVPAGYSRVRHRLRLEISDIADHDEAGVLPALRDIQRLLAFSSTIATVGGTTLIHCQAGISRSTACAYSVLCQLMGPGAEDQALELVLRIRPSAFPNRRIVALSDELLGRHGTMTEAMVRRRLLLTR